MITFRNEEDREKFVNAIQEAGGRGEVGVGRVCNTEYRPCCSLGWGVEALLGEELFFMEMRDGLSTYEELLGQAGVQDSHNRTWSHEITNRNDGSVRNEAGNWVRNPEIITVGGSLGAYKEVVRFLREETGVRE